MPKSGSKRSYKKGAGLAAAASAIQGAWRRYSRSRGYRAFQDSLPGSQRSLKLALDSKWRSPPTITRTKQIKKGKVLNEGTGGQCSYFYGPVGKSYLPDHVLNALPPYVVQQAAPGQYISAVGQQNIYTSNQLFTPSQATTATGNKISRIVFVKGTADTTINNIYLSNVYVKIYDIMARKDVSSSLLLNPSTAWYQGDLDTSSSGAYLRLGATPFQTELFNQFYEVKQVTDVVLAAGGTHVHHALLHPNKIISAAHAQYAPYAFQRLSYFTMVELHGSPANDTGTQSQVSIGVGGLNVISDSEVHIKQLLNATPSITVLNALPSSFTTAEQVVNMGGSIIQAQAEG